MYILVHKAVVGVLVSVARLILFVDISLIIVIIGCTVYFLSSDLWAEFFLSGITIEEKYEKIVIFSFIQ